MSVSGQYLIALAVLLIAASGVYADPPQKDGTLDDFRGLGDEENIAKNAFELPLFLDASSLEETNHYSRHSAVIELKPDARYTLGIVYRAEGPSVVSAGMKWEIPDEPPGLVDTESIRARWPRTDDWRLGVLTFRSDHEHTTARIILKAYGGMSLEVKNVGLVEGWYCD